jgi:exonuclease SbcC
MLIERLELRNFEGYRRAVIEFTEGLNIITGRNSTGKTTILEALLFALYGAAPSGRKSVLVSRLHGSSSSMSVRLVMRAGGRSVEVLREGRLAGKGSKEFRTERVGLRVDGRELPIHTEEELNREVIRIVGMGAREFTTLIYARQGELTSVLEPRKEDMDLVLRITLMKELAEQIDAAEKILEKYDGEDAKTMLRQLKERELPLITKQICDSEGEERRLSEEVEGLREVVERARSREAADLLQKIGRRDSLQREIGEKRAAISHALSERGASSLKELEGRLSELVGRAEEIRGRVEGLREEEKRIDVERRNLSSRLSKIMAHLEGAGAAALEELEGKMRAAQAEYDRLFGELRAAEADLSEVERVRGELSGKASALREEVKARGDLLAKGAANCPTCGQPVNRELVERLLEDEKGVLEQLEAELERAESQYSDLKKRVEGLRGSASKLGATLAALQEAHNRVVELLDGATAEDLERRLKEAEEKLAEARRSIEGLEGELAALEKEEDSLRGAVEAVRRLKEEGARLEGELQKCLEEIGLGLKALSLPFRPEDADLKAKIAERLPLSPEELARRERELAEKAKRLEEVRGRLEGVKRREREVKDKISALEKRLERARVCGELAERIRGGIEERRRRRLRDIADEALKVYESLTDQRVYRAFKINEDDYAVEVSPERLEGYISARRVGGGHQTLIALAVRVALLNVLNRRSLLILDEPTYGVDSENLPQLMSYVSEAAKKIGQTILVTHHGLGEEEAANIIKVSIGEDGSSTVSRGQPPL